MSADSDMTKALRRISSQLKLLADPEELRTRILATIADEGYVRDIFDQRFETEGASAGETWDDLKPKTQQQRLKQGFGGSHPILQRSSTLREHVVGGTQEVSEAGITITPVDAPAPIYKGNGKIYSKAYVKKLIKSGATVGNLSDYMEALNAVRPFLQAPTDKELAPSRKRFQQLLAETLKRVKNGESISDVLTRI